MQNIIEDIIHSLSELAEEKRRRFAQTSYPTCMQILGVTVPNLKGVLKEVKIQVKGWEPESKINLCRRLIETDIFECQQLAFELLGRDKKALATMTSDDIEAFGKNLDNWISVDYYAVFIVGYAWRTGKIGIEWVKEFLKSDNIWIKRIAIVATVALNQKARGGTGDASQTLSICQLAVEDHEEMIIKALSWALRELAKVDPESVAEFMELHREKLHKKALREVTHKLEFGTKY